jgi:thioredoxin reductase (NADPH)
MYDVIIIGGGPAGLTTAIYCSRSNLKTLIIDRSDSLLLKTKNIENYFGILEISGKKTNRDREKTS